MTLETPLLERLLWAGQYNRLEVLSSVLSARPELVHYTDSDQYTALQRVTYSHHLAALELLLHPGARTEEAGLAIFNIRILFEYLDSKKSIKKSILIFKSRYQVGAGLVLQLF